MQVDKRKRKSSARHSLNSKETIQFQNDNELLGFNPEIVIDDLINSIHDSACDIVDEYEYRTCKKYPNHIEEIQNGFDDFLDKWDPAIDKYCDKFELFALKNSFKISPSLKTLIGQDKQREEQNDTEKIKNELIKQHNDIDKEINKLYQQLYEEKCKSKYLELTLNEIENNIPNNLDEISLYLNENPLTFDEISSSLNTLSNQFIKLQNNQKEFQCELSKLPLSVPSSSNSLELNDKFISHSKQSDIQSISKLDEFTDAMLTD